MLTATPAKLRDGSWGARIQGTAAQGDSIQITTKAGKSWTATVDHVVWTDGKASLVATVSDRSAAASTARTASSFRSRRARREDEECELCGKNKYSCGHCIGW